MKPGTVRRAVKRRGGSLSGIPSFDAASFLTSVGVGPTARKYSPKQIVFRQGTPGNAVYYIQKGKIQLSVISEHGKEAITAHLGDGEFFGEGCLAGQAVYMTSAAATAESLITRIEVNAMIRMLHEQPKVSEMFMAFLLSRNIQIEADLVDQLFNSSERRLARLLLLLANFGKEGKMETVIPKISQDVLAAKVGTTRSRINFFMNKFRKLGFIEYGRGSEADGGALRVHSSLLNVVVRD